MAPPEQDAAAPHHPPPPPPPPLTTTTAAATPPPKLRIHPPLLNTACPWATSEADLAALLSCAATGAVTTRTSLLGGFAHDDAAHRFVLFDPATATPVARRAADAKEEEEKKKKEEEEDVGLDGSTQAAHPGALLPAVGSVNSLGYSPVTLDEYLAMLARLSASLPARTHRKTVIVSVTGDATAVASCHGRITAAAAAPAIRFPLAMEVNLSCPNIPSAPPPAYSPSQLDAYLAALLPTPTSASASTAPVAVGLKLPPLTYDTQFADLVDALRPHGRKLSFVTATNTLGSCMVFEDDGDGNGDGAASLRGGMAGAPLHPLALGNVSSLRRLFDQSDELRHLDIIGVGGVSDGNGYRRMRRAGAAIVGLATGLGSQGVAVFDAIENDVASQW
ncbi:dihydroorotate dehydrogenase-like protein [Purpureocillium lavendulum]|uniref:Dihydroorotate dehydrogenase-like protein n=1 Tax=Purpureocillium lavendulum TaxID=1247861 RepID=A0AB34FW91_9HYPO|nr:dihydroorotate dehydrogenase-like protein [Purpureocillium lavendulum]